MNSTNGIITVFAGSASRPFAQKMCDYLGVELGKSTTHIFSEGGIYVRADESIRNKDVYIVQSIGKDPNNAFTELIFLDRCVQACKCKLNNRNNSLFRLCKSRQKG